MVKTDLPFPEGVAVAAVLTTTVGGEEISSKEKRNGIWLAVGALIAALYKFGESSLKVFRGTLEGVISIGRYNVGGVERKGWMYGGLATSPALLAVGWIIGPRIASFVLIGGLMGWVVIAPIVVLVGGLPIPPDEYVSLGTLIGGFYTV